MCQLGWSSLKLTAQLSPYNHTSAASVTDTQPVWITDRTGSTGNGYGARCEKGCVCKQVSACVSVHLHGSALWCAQAILLSGLHLISLVIRTFIDAESPSASSQSKATWTMQEEVGKLWLDCATSRERKTMSFFLGEVTAQLASGTSDKKRQMSNRKPFRFSINLKVKDAL